MDLNLVYDDVPTEQELRSLQSRLPLTRRRSVSYGRDSRFESFWLEGVKYDLAHRAIESWNRILETVLTVKLPEATIPAFQQCVVDVVDGVSLLDDADVARWKKAAGQYPDALMQAMVEEHLVFSPRWAYRKRAAARDDVLRFQEMAIEAARAVFAVLLALNFRFHPGSHRRAETTLDELPVAPDNVGARLRESLITSPLVACDYLESVIDDVFTLAADAVPTVCVLEAKELFDYVPPERAAPRSR